MNVCAAHELLTSIADVISMEKWTLATSPAECSINETTIPEFPLESPHKINGIINC